MCYMSVMMVALEDCDLAFMDKSELGSEVNHLKN